MMPLARGAQHGGTRNRTPDGKALAKYSLDSGAPSGRQVPGGPRRRTGCRSGCRGPSGGRATSQHTAPVLKLDAVDFATGEPFGQQVFRGRPPLTRWRGAFVPAAEAPSSVAQGPHHDEPNHGHHYPEKHHRQHHQRPAAPTPRAVKPHHVRYLPDWRDVATIRSPASRDPGRAGAVGTGYGAAGQGERPRSGEHPRPRDKAGGNRVAITATGVADAVKPRPRRPAPTA
jgi:hypothetical protein